MSELQRKALVTVPMTAKEIESIYADASDVGKRMCESHERLRAELEGAQKLLAEQKPGVE